MNVYNCQNSSNCIVYFFEFLFYFIFIFIYFWLRWVFVWVFFSCIEWGLLFVAVRGLLIAVASLVAEHRLQVHGLSSCGSWALEHRLSSCGTWAQLLRSMWDLPRPGIQPASPALAGGFLTTALPGKSQIAYFKLKQFILCKLFLDKVGKKK